MNDLGETIAQATGRTRLVTGIVASLVALFLLAPIGIMMATSLTSAAYLGYPPHLFSLRWYSQLVDDPQWGSALWVSVRVAAGAAVLATLAGTAAALAVRRMNRGASWLRTLFVAPIVVPIVAYAVGLFVVFNQVNMVGTLIGILLGQAVLTFPIVFITVSGGLAAVDPAYTRAAESMGAYWPLIVRTIELPLIMRTVLAGMLFAFVYAFDEVVVALYLSSPSQPTLPVAMWNAAYSYVTPVIAAVGVMIMGVGLAVIGMGGLIIRYHPRGATEDGNRVSVTPAMMVTAQEDRPT